MDALLMIWMVMFQNLVQICVTFQYHSTYNHFTMQHQEKYTITWHNYSDHLREALREMITSSGFADVTLVTDDKQQIRAHRNILSGCSPVFKSILQIDSNSTNPVIYLRGIQHSEMESIMQFIYLGEAKFNEERMSEFLMVSKNLEIKYLSTGIERNDQTPSDESVEHDNNIADENMDLDEGTTYPFNEDGGEYVVESQVSTKSEIQNKSSNKRATTELLSDDGKLKCQECERIFNSQPALGTTPNPSMKVSSMPVIIVTTKQQQRVL